MITIKSIQQWGIAVLAIASSLGMSGCSTLDVKSHYAAHTIEKPLEADYYQIDIPTHDGINLRATLYQPELAPGETAPIVIHSHGFGGFRAPRPMSIYGQLIISGQAAMEAWENKYWVISYDQRGFGDSDGDVHIMDPDHEVKDVSSIIDWIEKSLPQVTRDQNNDLVVGMVGESYGGGAQLLASIFDPRIDAIVPITTWHNLAESLAPNGHVRTAWGGVLMSAGTISSFFDFGKAYTSPYLDMVGGKLNVAAEIELERRSVSTYCQQGKYPQADMLLMQGFRDTIFPINQAYKNWRCAKQASLDARLVAMQGGHILPWPMQSWSGMPFYNTEDKIRCGAFKAETIPMIVSFFDEKLKNKSVGNPIPKLCITVPDGEGLVAQEFPKGGFPAVLQSSELDLIHSGWFEAVLQPMDRLMGVVWSRDNDLSDLNEVTGGGMRPAFKPLVIINESQQLVGIPNIDITLKTTDDDKESVVFIGLGVRKKGEHTIELASEQLTPLTGDGKYKMALTAVSQAVEPGDQVGLVMQGFSGQFFWNPEGWFESAELTGRVDLPLQSTAVATNAQEQGEKALGSSASKSKGLNLSVVKSKF
ncbi:MAG: CocE/NonD family hydrolase [Pseudomonadales bacterium]|nr:CocE/NonD family hydrolase [Pseudomonadales bacterium]